VQRFVYDSRQVRVVELPELEQRLSNLQQQVERLWRKAEASVPPIEQRLAAMADQYADYLKRWASTVERHTQAVTQLEEYASEWKDASSRVRQETTDRLQELEATVEREWDVLKRMQEQPIRELREQAESLQQASLAMARASEQGTERAEARFASFETEVHFRLAELTRELRTALTEMRLHLDRPDSARDSSAPWSLDDVTRLHGQLRDGARVGGDVPRPIDSPSMTSLRELPGPSSGDPRVALPNGLLPRWSLVATGVGIVVVLAIVFGWRLQSQVKEASDRAYIAERKLDAALSDAAKENEAARRAAEKQYAEMREVTQRAQRMSEVAAAPDLLRFTLLGADGASGQGLFSRSRGVVVNGWRLPLLRGNATYVAWLLTRTTPVKAGTLTVQPDGTATLVLQQTPTIPRAVVGVMVTAESQEAGDVPSGMTVLTSVVSPGAAATSGPAPPEQQP